MKRKEGGREEGKESEKKEDKKEKEKQKLRERERRWKRGGTFNKEKEGLKNLMHRRHINVETGNSR